MPISEKIKTNLRFELDFTLAQNSSIVMFTLVESLLFIITQVFTLNYDPAYVHLTVDLEIEKHFGIVTNFTFIYK